ncbi:hypothetical protein F5146DRAFT_1004017 [Armillaria mellea]|nr:hypothetical protein F5146DRAFT_1004017 [Armillaria mellea]
MIWHLQRSLLFGMFLPFGQGLQQGAPLLSSDLPSSASMFMQSKLADVLSVLHKCAITLSFTLLKGPNLPVTLLPGQGFGTMHSGRLCLNEAIVLSLPILAIHMLHGFIIIASQGEKTYIMFTLSLIQSQFRTPTGRLMSAFLDLEASVAHDDVESSDSEDDDDFIADEKEWDCGDMTESPTADLFADISTPSVEEDRWDDLMERARIHASTSEKLLDSNEGFKLGLLDAAPGLWVLSCWGIKAAFIMPLSEKGVWLEADVSADLKSWLVNIPGVVHHNQQVVLHAVSHKDSRCTLSSTTPPVVMPGSWIKVHRGPSKGDIGMVSKLYPWRCKVLLVPMFNPRDRMYRQAAWSQVDTQAVRPYSEWCFQIRDKIMDTSRCQSGAIHGIGDQSLEVDFPGGLFSVKWANCRKDFHIGQYMEISEGSVADRWSGWICTVENETLELIHPHASTVETCSVHPNAIIAITEPNGDEGLGDQEEPSLGWKGRVSD